MKILAILATVFLLQGCDLKPTPTFWYPVEYLEVNCGTFKGNVYLMTNTTGWSSQPYIIDAADKKRVILGDSCFMKTQYKLPEWKGRDALHFLTPEQKAFIVEGFI